MTALSSERLSFHSFFFFIYIYIYLAFYGFIDRSAEDMTGNREREGE